MTADELRIFQTKPLEPFRIDLVDGDSIFITRRFQIAVMPKQFACSVNEKLRFVKLDRVARVEKLKSAVPGNQSA